MKKIVIEVIGKITLDVDPESNTAYSIGPEYANKGIEALSDAGFDVVTSSINTEWNKK